MKNEEHAEEELPVEGEDPRVTRQFELVQVIDRLEVGPVVVEPRRLVMPYHVIRSGEAPSSFELIYRYEEPVFDATDESSHNLAGMIGAQVALNYGLFCRTMAFQGPFDETDRRFLHDMAENTAREIYVKKFLEPNPFLLGPAASMAPLKASRYCRAHLEFDALPSPKGPKGRSARTPWHTDKNRHAVLSSGGKDSLLTFGLLNEIGRDVHPIYMNEAGRHWFTALNSYRYFRDTIANTGRVWLNSDRFFVWMLRHMPFVRQDFSRFRSDEYPIRLWTVAVFLFGAFPLIRKRGIGRLLIGDEFDTTRRLTKNGITHYDGLYDQSFYFDNALSRYYMKKGWGVSQFSILRPLSELLIESILVNRYPHLQEHQVSCHATHQEGERIKPCGHCEKCRRIVAMLLALEADPRNCGYTDTQIRQVLRDLPNVTLHQESACAYQTISMLQERGRLSLPKSRQKSITSHPETVQLRFDHDHSPLNAIPVDLRQDLYPIYLAYAHNAVFRKERTWSAFDPLGWESIVPAYPFED